MNRRTFFAAACGSVAAACTGAARRPGPSPAADATSGLRIDRVELFPVRYPMVGYFKFFAGPDGHGGRAAILIRVTANDGSVGWGQSVPIARWSDETLETATVALEHYFAPAVIGRDPHDLAGAHAAFSAAIAPGFSTGMPITRAGLDLALHDLCARRAGQSLATFLGLRPAERLLLSWTVNVTRLADAETLLQQGHDRGYRHFNIKVGPDPTFDGELARLVRRFAPDGFLWADANGGYEPDTALRATKVLADAGVDVLEAPLRPNRIAGYRQLRQQRALPILMDEGVVTADDLREFHQLGMLDGVAMKPSRAGGLGSCRAQIEYCEQHGLTWLGSGLTDPDLSFAATLQLYAGKGLQRPAALNGPQFLAGDVLRSPIVVADGYATVPTGPGLGVEVDERKVHELVQRSRRR